jgi:HEAT repeat protein
VWRFVALLLALVAGVAAAVWYYRAAPTEPPVSVVVRNDDHWLDDLQSRSPKDVERATAELEQRGSAALPAIRRALQDPAAEPARRRAALKAAALLGPRAVESLPDVAAALSDPAYSPEAGLALSFMGSPAVQTLREAQHSDEPVVRREALRALGKLRERASIDPQLVIPLLLDGLKDSDAAVRHVAVTYLGIVRDQPAPEVAGLVTALADSVSDVRSAAALALSSYGSDAAPAVPDLTRVSTKDPDDDVKREAARALVHIAEVPGRANR